MKHAELSLRKELAVARMLIARTEMALARAEQRKSLAVVTSALDLASSVLAQGGFGTWGRYLRLALRVAHGLLAVDARGLATTG